MAILAASSILVVLVATGCGGEAATPAATTEPTLTPTSAPVPTAATEQTVAPTSEPGLSPAELEAAQQAFIS